jgi:hypothetical protein
MRLSEKWTEYFRKVFHSCRLLRASRQILVVFLEEENKQETSAYHVSELLPGRAKPFFQN